uniref:Uncharacterized protein n=1 Tax=Arundo donax TaxID=35708 RepID=A0A0A9A5W7_ARUDO
MASAAPTLILSPNTCELASPFFTCLLSFPFSLYCDKLVYFSWAQICTIMFFSCFYVFC